MDILSTSHNRSADFYRQQTSSQNLENTFADMDQADMTDKELKAAALKFESYFINRMFTEMRRTINRDNSVIPESHAERIFTQMLDEQVSQTLAESGGIGIAQALYEQMRHANTGITLQQFLERQQSDAEQQYEQQYDQPKIEY